MSTSLQTPKEIDTALAAKFHELDRIESKQDAIISTIKNLAGAKYYYRGRRRVTDMTLDAALEILTIQAMEIEEYKATHERVESDGWKSTDWSEWNGVVAPYDNEKPAKYLVEYNEILNQRQAKLDEIEALNDLYTGWSRFFVVTSSQGHIHSTRGCHTCRATTTFGWLPELSGKNEAEAVEAHGSVLCSVCFPSAPVEHQGGKLTKAAAIKVAA